MKAISEEMFNAIMSIQTYTGKRDFCRDLTRVLQQIESELSGDIHVFEKLKRVATAEEEAALLEPLQSILALQPDTDNYPLPLPMVPDQVLQDPPTES